MKFLREMRIQWPWNANEYFTTRGHKRDSANPVPGGCKGLDGRKQVEIETGEDLFALDA